MPCLSVPDVACKRPASVKSGGSNQCCPKPPVGGYNQFGVALRFGSDLQPTALQPPRATGEPGGNGCRFALPSSAPTRPAPCVAAGTVGRASPQGGFGPGELEFPFRGSDKVVRRHDTRRARPRRRPHDRSLKPAFPRPSPTHAFRKWHARTSSPRRRAVRRSPGFAVFRMAGRPGAAAAPRPPAQIVCKPPRARERSEDVRAT